MRMPKKSDRVGNFRKKFITPSFRNSKLTKKPTKGATEESNMLEACMSLLGAMPKNTRQKLKDEYLKNANAGEQFLVDDILGYLTKPEDVINFFAGAHMVFENEGTPNKSYSEWLKACNDFQSRPSSHPSNDTQYGFTGNVIGHALIGTTKPPKQGGSWIQLEGSPIGGLKDFKRAPVSFIIDALLHFVDFINYKITKQNIARWGRSPYTDKNPLTINTTGITKEVAKERAALWKEIILISLTNMTNKKANAIEYRENINKLTPRMKKAGIDISSHKPSNRINA